MMFTLCIMKTYPSAQPLGFFDVELRGPWLEAKSNPLSRLEAVVGLINLFYNLTRYEQMVRLKRRPRTAA
jgi:hypothetical protein